MKMIVLPEKIKIVPQNTWGSFTVTGIYSITTYKFNTNGKKQFQHNYLGY